MKVISYDMEFDVDIFHTTYADNRKLAIVLLEMGEYGYEPFANLSVNLPESDKLEEENMAFVDTNNCPWAEKLIVENNLGEFAEVYAYSGWCEYPLYRFNLEEIPDINSISLE